LYARADPAAGADPRQPDVLLALPDVGLSAAAGRTGGIFRDDRRYAAHEPAAALRRGPNQRGPPTLHGRRLCVVGGRCGSDAACTTGRGRNGTVGTAPDWLGFVGYLASLAVIVVLMTYLIRPC